MNVLPSTSVSLVVVWFYTVCHTTTTTVSSVNTEEVTLLLHRCILPCHC